MSLNFQDFAINYFKNRKINDEEIKDFLNFDFEKDNLSPFDFVNMNKSIERLKKAIDNKGKILVYTDYDCDGIPAAVIFTDFFNKINFKDFQVYIPHRHNEGYGLHKDVLERFLCNGYSLVITADLGITNIEEVKFLKEKGVDIILSDHHLPIILEGKEILPDTPFLINPNISYETYKNKNLCGAAVAWKIVHAFLVKYRQEFDIPEGWEKWLLDMVAIALVADMMELKGETRKLVKFGLMVLRKSPRPAIQKICSLNKIEQKNINEKDIALILAPRINAASRIDHPILAYKALANIDNKGQKYAQELESLNTKRKLFIKDITSFIKDKKDSVNKNIVFIGENNWPIGVVGLVANKICEENNCIALVWGKEGEILRGSVRAPENYGNVVNLLTECKDLLVSFGGHEKAGGFALHERDLPRLEKKLESISSKISKKEILKNEDQSKTLIDMSIKNENINDSFFEYINQFGPFGIGNREPVFELILENDLKIKKFGDKGQHIEIIFDENITGVLFNVSDPVLDNILRKKNFFGSFEYDHWRKKYQFKINLDII